MNEIWRTIPGYDYEVSSFGRVRRATAFRQFAAGFVLKGKLDFDGYPVVNLSRQGKYWHVKISVLVCRAFHGDKPTPRHHAAHEDGNKQNNHESNLSWKTPSENEHDKRRQGIKAPHGEKHSQHVLTEQEVVSMRADHKAGMNICAVARKYKRAKLTTYDAVIGKTWSHVA